MRTISRAKLLVLINNAKRGTFAKVIQVSDPKFKKGVSNELGITSALKVTELSVILGSEYQNRVESQLVKENKDISEYQKGESWWKPANENYTIAEHKKNDKLKYLIYSPYANSYPRSKYLINGKIKSDVPDSLKPSKSKPTNQGTDKEVLIRVLKLDGIRTIQFGGKAYRVL